jgi:hypothetical protein
MHIYKKYDEIFLFYVIEGIMFNFKKDKK